LQGSFDVSLLIQHRYENISVFNINTDEPKVDWIANLIFLHNSINEKWSVKEDHPDYCLFKLKR
jgi:hypothetical protein